MRGESDGHGRNTVLHYGQQLNVAEMEVILITKPARKHFILISRKYFLIFFANFPSASAKMEMHCAIMISLIEILVKNVATCTKPFCTLLSCPCYCRVEPGKDRKK